MNFIKKHKIALIVAGVVLVLIVLLIFMILSLLSVFGFTFKKGDDSILKYGNRLDGIEDYPISSETIDEIKKTLTDTGYVNSVEYDLQGRIIYFMIEVKDDVDLTSSRSLADKIAEKFTDDIKSFYDIQVLIDCENEESELYPTIGAKHKTSNGFKWNNS